MDGIQNLAGRDIRLTLCGVTYRLSEKTLDEYAEQEAHICSLKPSPLSLLKDLPPIPPEPNYPVPPDAKTQTEEQVRAFQQAKQQYQEEQRQYLIALTTRDRLEDRLIKLAQRPVVASWTDMDEFEGSMHGMSWRLWRALRKHHGDQFPTWQHVHALIEPLTKFQPMAGRAIGDAVEKAEGRDLLKNSSAPMSGATPEKNTSPSPGHNSTGDLATATAGIPELSAV